MKNQDTLKQKTLQDIEELSKNAAQKTKINGVGIFEFLKTLRLRK